MPRIEPLDSELQAFIDVLTRQHEEPFFDFCGAPAIIFR